MSRVGQAYRQETDKMRDDKTAARTGLFVIVGCVLFIAVVIIVGRRTQFFQDRYPLEAVFRNVQGLRAEAPVRIAGVTAGNVKTINITESTAGSQVTVALEIYEKYAPHIRTDSLASIRTLGPLGDKYIEVSIGSKSKEQLRRGQRIFTTEPLDLYETVEKFHVAAEGMTQLTGSLDDTIRQFKTGDALTNFEEATLSIKNILAKVEKGSGVLNRLVFDEPAAEILDDLSTAVKQSNEIVGQVRSGEGALGALLYDDELLASIEDVKQMSGDLRALMREVREGEGLLHAVIYDPEEADILRRIGTTADRIGTTMQKLNSTDGSLGLLLNDPGLWEDMKRLLGGLQRSKSIRFLIERSLKKES